MIMMDIDVTLDPGCRYHHQSTNDNASESMCTVKAVSLELSCSPKYFWSITKFSSA